MKKIRAILFDVDGTLLDTTELIYQAFENAFNMHDEKSPGRQAFSSVFGKPITECYQILTNKNDVASYCEYHREYQLNNMHLSKPYANSLKTLQELKRSGFKTAAVTSRMKKSASLGLSKAHLSPLLDFAVFADEVTNHKPHPEPLHKAMEFLNVNPDETLMVGDSEADILGGKNAGVRTVGVLYGMNAEKLKLLEPDFTIDDISQTIEIVRNSD